MADPVYTLMFLPLPLLLVFCTRCHNFTL